MGLHSIFSYQDISDRLKCFSSSPLLNIHFTGAANVGKEWGGEGLNWKADMMDFFLFFYPISFSLLPYFLFFLFYFISIFFLFFPFFFFFFFPSTFVFWPLARPLPLKLKTSQYVRRLLQPSLKGTLLNVKKKRGGGGCVASLNLSQYC